MVVLVARVTALAKALLIVIGNPNCCLPIRNSQEKGNGSSLQIRLPPHLGYQWFKSDLETLSSCHSSESAVCKTFPFCWVRYVHHTPPLWAPCFMHLIERFPFCISAGLQLLDLVDNAWFWLMLMGVWCLVQVTDWTFSGWLFENECKRGPVTAPARYQWL